MYTAVVCHLLGCFFFLIPLSTLHARTHTFYVRPARVGCPGGLAFISFPILPILVSYEPAGAGTNQRSMTIHAKAPRLLSRTLCIMICAAVIRFGSSDRDAGSAPKSVPVEDYHAMGYFLRGIIETPELKYLQNHFQEYVVDRTVRNAAPDVSLDGDEDARFLNVVRSFGISRDGFQEWTENDISQIRDEISALVKLMRRRKKDEVDTEL